MTIIRNRATINLTEEERKAIETVKRLANDIFYGLKPEEINRFNSIMKTAWGNNPSNVEVAICDLACLLDRLQENIDKFNADIDLN